MTEEKRTGDEIAREIIKQPVEEWLDEQYINYALYVILSRALVNRDGLKPVNRRLLWSMYRDNILPTSQYVKAAQISGNTSGAFHPHAGTAASGALAKMAQKFSTRVPLIDYMGSVGYVTGDAAASDRYWEARLTPAAVELLKETKHNGAEMVKNFSGTLDEPAELPVRWPVDIINGSMGIAVGFASNMPPHNPTEVMNAAKALVKNPDMTVKQLMRHMKGPDFPTGGELIGVDGIREYYETGSGKFRIRGSYRVEDMSRGRKRIVFYELPYQVPAEDVRNEIVRVQNNNGLKGLAQVRDSTDRKNGLRLVIETKAGSNHLAVINEIFKRTSAEISFSVNNTVIREGAPTVISMIDMLKSFIDFRREIVERMSNSRLESCDKRKHQLDGILAVLVDIDKAVKIIRESDAASEAKASLRKGFKIDEDQAEYILSMPLRRLTKSDSIELENEKKALDQEIADLHEILSDPAKMAERIESDLEATLKVIKDQRRTTITGLTSDDAKEAEKAAAKAAAAIEKNSPCFVTRFTNGTLLMTSDAFEYSQSERDLKYGLVAEQIKVNTQDSIVVVLSDGTARRVPVTYVSTSVPSDLSTLGVETDASLVGIAKNEPDKSGPGLALATKNGTIKIAKAAWPGKDEFPVITLDDDDELVNSRWLGKSIKSTSFILASSDGNALIFDAESVRPSGPTSRGVKGMKLRPEAQVVGFDWLRSATAADTAVLTFTGKTVKLTPVSLIPAKNKGGQGVSVHSFRKGEDAIKGFYAGIYPAISVATGDMNEAVQLPPYADKRGGASTPMPLPVEIGGRGAEVL